VRGCLWGSCCCCCCCCLLVLLLLLPAACWCCNWQSAVGGRAARSPCASAWAAPAIQVGVLRQAQVLVHGVSELVCTSKGRQGRLPALQCALHVGHPTRGSSDLPALFIGNCPFPVSPPVGVRAAPRQPPNWPDQSSQLCTVGLPPPSEPTFWRGHLYGSHPPNVPAPSPNLPCERASVPHPCVRVLLGRARCGTSCARGTHTHLVARAGPWRLPAHPPNLLLTCHEGGLCAPALTHEAPTPTWWRRQAHGGHRLPEMQQLLRPGRPVPRNGLCPGLEAGRLL